MILSMPLSLAEGTWFLFSQDLLARMGLAVLFHGGPVSRDFRFGSHLDSAW